MNSRALVGGIAAQRLRHAGTPLAVVEEALKHPVAA